MPFMIFNPIIALLYNAKLNRWHPILYYESPLPGNPENLVRHKSKGHHTEGFATRDEAVASAKQLAEQLAKEECCDVPAKFALEEDMPWDGEGIPASVAFFIDQGGGNCKRVM